MRCSSCRTCTYTHTLDPCELWPVARTLTHTFNQRARRCTPSRLCRDSTSHAVRCRKLSLLNDMSRSATQQPASLSWSPATTASTWSTQVKERTYTNLYNLNLQSSHDDVGAKRGRNLRKCWHDDEPGSARGCGSHLRRRVAVQRQKWTPHQACEACKGRARGFRQRGGIPAPTAAQDAKFAPFAEKCPSKVRGWSIGPEKRERDTKRLSSFIAEPPFRALLPLISFCVYRSLRFWRRSPGGR